MYWKFPMNKSKSKASGNRVIEVADDVVLVAEIGVTVEVVVEVDPGRIVESFFKVEVDVEIVAVEVETVVVDVVSPSQYE